MTCLQVWLLALIVAALFFLISARRCWRRVGHGRLRCVPRVNGQVNWVSGTSDEPPEAVG